MRQVSGRAHNAYLAPMRIVTIGHEGVTRAALVATRAAAALPLVADIRAVPPSRRPGRSLLIAA